MSGLFIKHTPKLFEPRFANGSDWIFWCPACKAPHRFAVGQPGYYSANWSFDGNLQSPSFSPSLRYTDGSCHLFVTNGSIKYCDDYPKPVWAGKTVPMEPIPEGIYP